MRKATTFGDLRMLRWEDETVTLLTSELDRLPPGGRMLSGDSSLDDTVGEWASAALTFSLVGGHRMGHLSLYVIPALYLENDWPQWGDPPEHLLQARLRVLNAFGTQRMVVPRIDIGFGHLRVGIINNTGAYFAPTGNTLTLHPYGFTV